MVLDAGNCVECGSPSTLLSIENGIFKSLVDATGPSTAAKLTAIAKKTKEIDNGNQ